MSIENIGFGKIRSSETVSRIPAHKIIQRSEAVRKDSYIKAKWPQESENQRLRTEAYHVANINKINKNVSREAGVPEHFYKGNAPAYMRNVGTSFDVKA